MWRTVSINENYEVNENGEIRSVATGNLIKPRLDRYGYLRVNLYGKGKMQTGMVHRLVATAFCDNPYKLNCVNHKDEDKTNNRADNLEWCDVAYNNSYGTHVQRVAEKKRKSVIAYKDGLSLVFDSAVEAEKALGIGRRSIGRVARGELKTTHGYRFEFAWKEVSLIARQKTAKEGKEIKIDFGTANPKQLEFYKAKTTFVAYGGAKGGG